MPVITQMRIHAKNAPLEGQRNYEKAIEAESAQNAFDKKPTPCPDMILLIQTSGSFREILIFTNVDVTSKWEAMRCVGQFKDSALNAVDPSGDPSSLPFYCAILARWFRPAGCA